MATSKQKKGAQAVTLAPEIEQVTVKQTLPSGAQFLVFAASGPGQVLKAFLRKQAGDTRIAENPALEFSEEILPAAVGKCRKKVTAISFSLWSEGLGEVLLFGAITWFQGRIRMQRIQVHGRCGGIREVDPVTAREWCDAVYAALSANRVAQSAYIREEEA